MSIKFKYKIAEVNHKQNNSRIKKKVNWDKVDKEWYSAYTDTHIDSLQIKENMEETAVEEGILKLCELLRETADLTSSSKAIFNAKPKLKVWTPEIQVALKQRGKKYKVWKNHGKPNNKNNKMLMEKKQSKKDFRRAVRIELAKQKKKNKEKETILETRTKDAKMFHKLVRNNRKKGNDAIMELEVNGEKYVENDNIINGFQEHFSSLATFNEKTRIDSLYYNLVEDDIQSINKLVQQNNIKNVTSEEITKAIRSINKGKSADYHGITIEHIIYAGSDTEKPLVPLVQCIFKHGSISETLKMGLLTLVFKNKGTRQQAINYREITVLPVIGQIIETIIKKRTNDRVLETQNKKQRGFTAGSSSLNSALPIEESYRESKDNNITLYLVLLDAKAAFDTVIHSHMLRRVFLAGIDDGHQELEKTCRESELPTVRDHNGQSRSLTPLSSSRSQNNVSGRVICFSVDCYF
ncbi:unnamed protein product [Mytilus coruscus]|uniref:Uncharacterized protein n=1 Tax=Mytilus coruscus TaxID=42192 RepID=A0A6J8D1T6_MYTCO|nr:unnamed protein product [Mytilus coruscus]